MAKNKEELSVRLSDYVKLSGMSTESILKMWRRECIDYEDLSITDQKVSHGTALNALVVWFLNNVDAGERHEAIAWGCAKVREILVADAEARGKASGGVDAPGGRRGDVRVERAEGEGSGRPGGRKRRVSGQAVGRKKRG